MFDIYQFTNFNATKLPNVIFILLEDEAKNFIYSCATLTETNLMTSLRILDQDRDFSPERVFNQGGQDHQYYNFEPLEPIVTGNALNPVEIRFDNTRKSWGLYSTDVSFHRRSKFHTLKHQ